MPISSLAITLSRDSALAEAARRALDTEACIEIGDRVGHRLPVVVDTVDRNEDRRVWEWLNGLDGVEFVDVVFIHFDDDEPTTAAGSGPTGGPAAAEESP